MKEGDNVKGIVLILLLVLRNLGKRVVALSILIIILESFESRDENVCNNSNNDSLLSMR